MKILSLEFKNFASYGNIPQVINFDQNKGNFYLVVGKNGAGKSTISDVITFAFYGKLLKKKLKDIPNRFNTNAMCKIVIEKSPGTVATIIRGINPSTLSLYINGVEYDGSNKRDVQTYIEEEIIGLPFYVFNNIISLSINDFKSFLSMSASDKRGIIDKIFGLSIINSIMWTVKYEGKRIKQDIELLSKEIEVLDRSMLKSKQELEKLEKSIESAILEKREDLESLIIEKNNLLSEIQTKMKDAKDKISEANKRTNDIHKLQSAHESIIKEVNKRKKLHELGKCPTCSSDLTTDEHVSMLNEWLEKEKVAVTELTKIETTLQKLNDYVSKANNISYQLSSSYSLTNSHIISAERELQKINSNNSDKQVSSLQAIIDDNKSKREEVLGNKITVEKRGNFYKVLESVFGDKGVKLSATSKILPALNNEINNVLEELNIEYKVSFNDDFDAEILHVGHQVAVSMLSTGEKKKIDFAVLISLIKLMKVKFQGLNMVFLDEIFSSIDADGIYHILEILSNRTKELKLNIFVINHTVLPSEIFDYSVTVQKTNGFSKLIVDKIE